MGKRRGHDGWRRHSHGGMEVEPGEMRLKVLSVGGDVGIVLIVDTARCD